ncbi:MAG: hypothetical protein IJH64_05895 [Oscillospiraceae bacterium]|nr:hypothetical protein [Oscillospiraceae bacterium]
MSLSEKLMVIAERADDIVYDQDEGVYHESLAALNIGQFVKLYEVCKAIADLYEDGDLSAAEIIEGVHEDSVVKMLREAENER